MPAREVLVKIVGFTLVVAALALGGVLVLAGSHPYNDYLNPILGWGLIGLGVVTAGFAVLVIGGVLYEQRLKEEESQIHVTPRVAPPAPPPPWGMGEVGRPPSGVVRVGGAAAGHGGGSPRVMSVAVSNIDGPLLILGLLAWTVIAVVFLAPTH